MISIPNTTIEVPDYSQKETLERLAQPTTISPERRAKNLCCISKLKGMLKTNSSAQINKLDGQQQVQQSQARELTKLIENASLAERSEYAL